MTEHIAGCDMWHHQGGDYDRDCAACMELAADDDALQRRGHEAARRHARGTEAVDPRAYDAGPADCRTVVLDRQYTEAELRDNRYTDLVRDAVVANPDEYRSGPDAER